MLSNMAIFFLHVVPLSSQVCALILVIPHNFQWVLNSNYFESFEKLLCKQPAFRDKVLGL
jgi:hypothetical protein